MPPRRASRSRRGRTRALFLSLAIGLPLTLTLGLAGCGLPAAVPPPLTGDTPVRVVAAFYPLEFLARRVGGDRVEVSGLTKPGAEPHDAELSARSLGSLSYAHLVVYLSGFQPAVDSAVEARASGTAYDVRADAGLEPTAGDAVDDPTGDPSTEPDAHTHDEAHDEGGDGHADDPHFWLDPLAYAQVGTALGERLASVDPRGAADYRANTARILDELTALDGQFTAGLAQCRSRTVVVGHAAFGHLAERYDLTQVPIAGLSPEQEPSARQLAEVAATVRAAGVRTVYAETLADPAFARTIAETTGALLATLDPIEGITTASAGTDYLEVMRADLAVLRTGQECS